MIYFDRIEVVNYLVPAAGTRMSVQQNQNISLSYLPVHFLSHLETLQH